MANTVIYLITNIDNNPFKAYVGKTTNFTVRKYNHEITFGPNIICDVIDEVDSTETGDWKFLECYWIEQFKQWGYELVNKNKGGGGCEYHSSKTKQLLSDQKKGKKLGKYRKRKDAGVKKGFFPKNSCQYCDKLIGINAIHMHELQCKQNPEHLFIPNVKNSVRYQGIKRSPYREGIKKPNVGAALRGRKKPLTKCPHCSKEGGSNMKRYHFDNCKYK